MNVISTFVKRVREDYISEHDPNIVFHNLVKATLIKLQSFCNSKPAYLLQHLVLLPNERLKGYMLHIPVWKYS